MFAEHYSVHDCRLPAEGFDIVLEVLNVNGKSEESNVRSVKNVDVFATCYIY